jgi:hypothetical protein
VQQIKALAVDPACWVRRRDNVTPQFPEHTPWTICAMDLRHLVHEMMPKKEIAAPSNHRSEDARSIGMLEMVQCCATRMRRPSQPRAIHRVTKRAPARGHVSRATIPRTAGKRRAGQQRNTRCKRGVEGAECNAHRGISAGNSHWANLLSFITNTTKQIMDPQRIHLTDIPTTWEEYQFMRDISSQPHNAFIVALNTDNNASLYHANGSQTKCPPMLREDTCPALSNCIPTVISDPYTKASSYGYQLPFEKTFDETSHQFGVSSLWTIADTDCIIDFAEQLADDASACFASLTEAGHNDTKSAVESGTMDATIVRMLCGQAAAMANKLVLALRDVRKQKQMYADMIITCGIDVPINGELWTLREYDGVYMYINQYGDKNIPF